MRTLPLAEAKAKLSGLIDDVARRDERVTITKRGRPTAVIMSHEEAASLDATLEIMSDPDFYAEILRNRRALDRGRGRAYELNVLLGEEGPTARGKPARRATARSGRRPPAAAPRTQAKGSRGAHRAPAQPPSRGTA